MSTEAPDRRVVERLVTATLAETGLLFSMSKAPDGRVVWDLTFEHQRVVRLAVEHEYVVCAYVVGLEPTADEALELLKRASNTPQLRFHVPELAEGEQGPRSLIVSAELLVLPPPVPGSEGTVSPRMEAGSLLRLIGQVLRGVEIVTEAITRPSA